MIPAWFWAAVTFVYGITIGSFLNVVIYRLPIGGSLTSPKHSYCPTCERRLEALDDSTEAVLGYLLGRG